MTYNQDFDIGQFGIRSKDAMQTHVDLRDLSFNGITLPVALR